jgi:hypothetical protein
MSKENVKIEEEQPIISDTGKDIKRGMDRYEDKMKSAGEEPPTGDITRSEE